MKTQLFTAMLVMMCLTVHCKQVKYTEGKLRSYRSPVNDGQFDEYGQPLEHNNGFSQEPQFDVEQGGVISNQEGPIFYDGDIQQGPLDENTPIGTDQTVQDKVAVLPTEDKYQPDSDEEDDSLGSAKAGKKNGPSINFFPVMFGSGRGRSGGFPAGTVAIANSFSTGRKGVATSNANAYADSSALYKNSYN